MKNNQVNRQRYVSILLFSLLLIALAGCDMFAKPEVDKETLLKTRVQERWDAMIALDFDKVYEFATPSYRQVNSKQHFFNQYAAQIKRGKIEITSIEIAPEESPLTAEVVVELFFVLGVNTGDPLELSSYNREKWIYRDDQWWHIEKK